MTKYYTLSLKLSNSQFNNVKSGITTCTEVNLSSNVIDHLWVLG